MLKSTLASVLAMVAGGQVQSAYAGTQKSERKAKNPNTPESQYRIARAEEKRERRKVARRLNSVGSGAYNTPDYFGARIAIREKVAKANEMRLLFIKNGDIKFARGPEGQIIDKAEGRVKARKPKKNAKRNALRA